jgi:hypothetical protein
MAEELAVPEGVALYQEARIVWSRHLVNNTTVEEELAVPEAVALKETRIVINSTMVEELVVPEAVAL